MVFGAGGEPSRTFSAVKTREPGFESFPMAMKASPTRLKLKKEDIWHSSERRNTAGQNQHFCELVRH